MARKDISAIQYQEHHTFKFPAPDDPPAMTPVYKVDESGQSWLVGHVEYCPPEFNPVPEVPLPAAGWLFLSAIVALMAKGVKSAK